MANCIHIWIQTSHKFARTCRNHCYTGCKKLLLNQKYTVIRLDKIVFFFHILNEYIKKNRNYWLNLITEASNECHSSVRCPRCMRIRRENRKKKFSNKENGYIKLIISVDSHYYYCHGSHEPIIHNINLPFLVQMLTWPWSLIHFMAWIKNIHTHTYTREINGIHVIDAIQYNEYYT